MKFKKNTADKTQNFVSTRAFHKILIERCDKRLLVFQLLEYPRVEERAGGLFLLEILSDDRVMVLELEIQTCSFQKLSFSSFF